MNEAKNTGLIMEQDGFYKLLPKLLQDQEFDRIRLENIIAVYDNEARPIKEVRETMSKAYAACDSIGQKALAAWWFEDECQDLSWEHHAYNKPAYDDINAKETATADPSPFFLEPQHPNGVGVLLLHGLLASPAEVKDYGKHLVKQGYTVMGVRLRGHGTSPYALREQSWHDWFNSAIRGYKILKAHCNRIFVTGFSTGGALALKLASDQLPEIIGICAVALPIRFMNPAFPLVVPLLHGTNRLVDMITSFEGVKPFIENDSEHPQVNYRHVPVKSLYELSQLIDEMEDTAKRCQAPVLILQGNHDPVVSFKSAEEIMEKLTCVTKRLQVIDSNRHGMLMENIGGTWEKIDAFMLECINETKTP